MEEKTTWTTGEVLQIFRKAAELNLTIAKLAEKMDLSAPYISRVEDNQKNFSEDTLKKLFDFYQIPISEFEKVKKTANSRKWRYQKVLIKACQIWLQYHPGG